MTGVGVRAVNGPAALVPRATVKPVLDGSVLLHVSPIPVVEGLAARPVGAAGPVWAGGGGDAARCVAAVPESVNVAPPAAMNCQL